LGAYSREMSRGFYLVPPLGGWDADVAVVFTPQPQGRKLLVRSLIEEELVLRLSVRFHLTNIIGITMINIVSQYNLRDQIISKLQSVCNLVQPEL
jgi:hypothetical protein